MFHSKGSHIKNGFTLLDALYHLVVFILLSQLIILIFIWIQKQNNIYLTNEDTTWELFVNDFQSYLVNVKDIKVTGYEDVIEITYNDGNPSVQIGQLKDVIRKQVDYVGNVPMLIGIQNLKYDLYENYLKIIVKYPNDVVKERTFFVQLYPE
ncbi:competence type IV pilus minor pilin ComGF [Ureibacillus acetophenoni]|uniref:Competence protein ComGF n=1 Tax=Ureibacillus acetophenoni TaxID=614649 RepID=A0A285U2P4_9BACL|nr:competence type IV pilus minor pilin ComGF [Ureibacillus acetophenoni]SOC36204.1 competence protein ComGF [Ureibacillus acetophenoni]